MMRGRYDGSNERSVDSYLDQSVDNLHAESRIDTSTSVEHKGPFITIQTRNNKTPVTATENNQRIQRMTLTNYRTVGVKKEADRSIRNRWPSHSSQGSYKDNQMGSLQKINLKSDHYDGISAAKQT